jgi:DNA polymerase III alpha subunit
MLAGKKHSEIEKEKIYFIACARKNGFRKGIAGRIFDTLRSFAPHTRCKGRVIAEKILKSQLAYLEENF